VLLSSFLVYYFKLNFTDPLCSLLISCVLLYSTWPILNQSSSILLHKLKDVEEDKINKIEKEVKSIPYKLNIIKCEMWNLSKDHHICEIKIKIDTSIIEKNNSDITITTLPLNSNSTEETSAGAEDNHHRSVISLQSEVYDRVKSVMKDNRIPEYYIEFL